MINLPTILSFTVILSSALSPVQAGASSSKTSSTTIKSSSTTTLPAKTPTLQKSYNGSTFFNTKDWNFFDTTIHPDPTWGQVNYVSSAKALSNPGMPLISTQKNAIGGINAVMRADNMVTLAAGQNRNSVRIGSTATYGVGSLVIVDLDHVPFGCSTWPAFWMVGKNWPYGGEIDIFEGINNGPYNQATLHTNNGCARDTTGVETGFAGANANCSTNGGYGCSVSDHNAQSYGSAFAAAGGGVWATSITISGISIWRWNRASIPIDITKGKPNSSSWGVPFALWKNTTCNISSHFTNMSIIFNIDICGSWAGNQALWEMNTCYKSKGFKTCSAVVSNPRNYDNAFFSIRSLNVYNI